MNALLLLLCCTKPAPPPAGPPALVGRYSPDALFLPSLSDGPALTGPDCALANGATRGNGPPCLVERWSTADGLVTLIRSGNRALLSGPTPRSVRTTWPTVGHVLGRCLGDPLAVPPADDPSGSRRFDGSNWVITLRGRNLCNLEGSLRLPVATDRADWSGLNAGGLAWDRGGRAYAEGILHGRFTDSQTP